MIKVGIVGAAGYAAGELIRILLNHPEAEIVFANSGSNAGNLFSDVHEGLLGETELRFTDELPLDRIDVLFICLGHGKSAEFLKNTHFTTLIGADGIHPTQAGYLNWWTPKMEAYLYDYLGQ